MIHTEIGRLGHATRRARALAAGCIFVCGALLLSLPRPPHDLGIHPPPKEKDAGKIVWEFVTEETEKVRSTIGRGVDTLLPELPVVAPAAQHVVGETAASASRAADRLMPAADDDSLMERLSSLPKRVGTGIASVATELFPELPEVAPIAKDVASKAKGIQEKAARDIDAGDLKPPTTDEAKSFLGRLAESGLQAAKSLWDWLCSAMSSLFPETDELAQDVEIAEHEIADVAQSAEHELETEVEDLRKKWNKLVDPLETFCGSLHKDTDGDGLPDYTVGLDMSRSARKMYSTVSALGPDKLKEVEAAVAAGWCGAIGPVEVFGDKAAKVHAVMDDGVVMNYPVTIEDCPGVMLSYWEAGCGGNTFGWLLEAGVPAVIASNFDGDVVRAGWGKDNVPEGIALAFQRARYPPDDY